MSQDNRFDITEILLMKKLDAGELIGDSIDVRTGKMWCQPASDDTDEKRTWNETSYIIPLICLSEKFHLITIYLVLLKEQLFDQTTTFHQLNESIFCWIHSSSLDSWFLYYWRRTTTYSIVLNFIYSCQTGGVAEFWKILPQPQVAKKAVFTYTWAWDGHHWRE